jgi:hypothetical protein
MASKQQELVRINVSKVGLKGKRPGLSPRGLHKTETEFTDFIEIFASLKSRKLSVYF